MERYPAISKIPQVEELRSRYRALVQINARTLLRKQPLLRRGFFDQLFKRNLVDFIATDTHALPGRETCLTEGMSALAQKYGDTLKTKIQNNPDIFFRS